MKLEEIKSLYPKTWAELLIWQKIKMQEWQQKIYKESMPDALIPPVEDKDVSSVLEAMFNFPNWNFLYEYFDGKNLVMTVDHSHKGFWCWLDDKQTETKENRVDAERDGFLLCFEVNENS